MVDVVYAETQGDGVVALVVRLDPVLGGTHDAFAFLLPVVHCVGEGRNDAFQYCVLIPHLSYSVIRHSYLGGNWNVEGCM